MTSRALAAITATLLLCFQIAFPQQKVSPIRSIDFANYKYPGSRGHFSTAEYATNGFTLRGGKSKQTLKQYGMTLKSIAYGDVTGDGVEEAMISLVIETDGSAGVNHVYIYTLSDGVPKFLWGFESGDRAWGGLKRVYAERGDLVVELYGRGTQIDGDLGATEPVGLCCPRSITRTRYEWKGTCFRQHGEMEILSLSKKSGSE